MHNSAPRLSRISKLLVDRDQVPPEAVLDGRRAHAVTLSCGEDLAQSYTLQLAALTAANLAKRCFPGAVRIFLPSSLAVAPSLLWPSRRLTFGEAIQEQLGADTLSAPGDEIPGKSLVFGNAPARSETALRVTFDGWIATVGPAQETERLAEREYCSLAGVLGAAIAISELFLQFADVTLPATRRTSSLSLWRPDLPASDPQALGVPVQFLPGDLWTLGLGHLGNAYLWSLASLPYRNPGEAEIFLNDFDRIEPDNVETSLLFSERDVGSYKTRAASAWLEALGFRTRLLERPFDEHFRCRFDEPKLAFCGFDTNRARRHIASAAFDRVVESGLGGTPNNFDTISLHTFPHTRIAAELWPDASAEDEVKRNAEQERLAEQNPAYSRTAEDPCGRYVLAGKSIAVPFVGAAAASMVVAEALRILHGGPSYSDVKISLAAPETRVAHTIRNYDNDDVAGLKYCPAQ